MEKASKWFRGLFTKKSTKPSSSLSNSPKKKWSFMKPKHHHHHNLYTTNKPTETSHHYYPQHQKTVGSDEYAAAVAAVHAAAEMVGLSSSRRAVITTTIVTSEAKVSENGAGYGIFNEEWAVVKIQSLFRAYLARRALRALKALVKIQALVRGYIVRKRTSNSIRRVQALLRLQARARVRRSQILEFPFSPLKNTPSRKGSRSNGKRTPGDDEGNAKILEIDLGTNGVHMSRNLFHSSHPSLSSDNDSHSFSTSMDSIAQQAIPSTSSEVQSFDHHKLAHDLLELKLHQRERDFHSSPHLYKASSKGGRFSHRGPVTLTRSDGAKSCLSGSSDSPSYMSYTESSKAKIRSASAPRQRPQQYERSSSAKRYSVHSYNDSKFNPLRVSGLQSNLANRAYPGSGGLDKLGMPMEGGDADVYCGGRRSRV
ncbi:hypothetical protein Leryth_022308 [Lithospermum erythrorhizon]|nr:hypothetical protein Leryth_022308 [Lithospermum erythrorhizon]